MGISERQVKNKRNSKGVPTGKPGTVYDVNIKYITAEGKKTYAKRGFLTLKEAKLHEAEMVVKLQNPTPVPEVYMGIINRSGYIIYLCSQICRTPTIVFHKVIIYLLYNF